MSTQSLADPGVQSFADPGVQSLADLGSQSFADLGVSRAVADALVRNGITDPFPVQRLVIGDVLAGRDVLVRSPTGSGKTLAFAVPLVDRIAATDARPAALVLAPTRELVSQIAEEIRAIAPSRALRVSAVYGGVGLHRQSVEAARAHILVATPGRLEDLIARGALTLDRIRVLVLDEADRMLDMGFRPAVDRIVRGCPVKRQTLFFSATLAGESGRVAATYTRDAVRREHTPQPATPAAAVEHRFVEVEHAARVPALVGELNAERDLALVFVRTKRSADRLVKHLDNHGVRAVAMHGNKSQGQRERALASFQDGRISTLVATDVAARGIDVEGISHVINYDAPDGRDAYVHRVGRTGRAGRGGVGITFHSAQERGGIARLARELGIAHALPASVTATRHAAARPTPTRTARRRPARADERGSAGGGRSSRRRRRAERAG
jgi:superfamily II DNA/RNA helicase